MNNNINNPNNSLIVSQPENKFVENIKQWVLIDTQMKLINEKTKKLREHKASLTSQIVSHMEKNNLQNSKIEITDGMLRLYNKKEYSPLTYGYIEKCLANIISDKSHVDYIIQYLKENREIKNEIDIRRT